MWSSGSWVWMWGCARRWGRFVPGSVPGEIVGSRSIYEMESFLNFAWWLCSWVCGTWRTLEACLCSVVRGPNASVPCEVVRVLGAENKLSGFGDSVLLSVSFWIADCRRRGLFGVSRRPGLVLHAGRCALRQRGPMLSVVSCHRQTFLQKDITSLFRWRLLREIWMSIVTRLK